MVIVDANVLISAVDETHVHHVQSSAWLDPALEGGDVVGFAWVAVLAFLRVLTNRSVYPNPVTVEEATDQVDAWLAAPGAAIVEATPRHAVVMHSLLREVGTAGNLVIDAHLAALAIEHRAEVVSFDRDFARFTGVRHRLPG